MHHVSLGQALCHQLMVSHTSLIQITSRKKHFVPCCGNHLKPTTITHRKVESITTKPIKKHTIIKRVNQRMHLSTDPILIILSNGITSLADHTRLVAHCHGTSRPRRVASASGHDALQQPSVAQEVVVATHGGGNGAPNDGKWMGNGCLFGRYHFDIS